MITKRQISTLLMQIMWLLLLRHCGFMAGSKANWVKYCRRCCCCSQRNTLIKMSSLDIDFDLHKELLNGIGRLSSNWDIFIIHCLSWFVSLSQSCCAAIKQAKLYGENHRIIKYIKYISKRQKNRSYTCQFLLLLRSFQGKGNTMPVLGPLRLH